MAYTYYTPASSEYSARIKDNKSLTRDQKRDQQQKAGLLKVKPGITSPDQKKNIDKLSQVIGKNAAKNFGQNDEAPGGGTPLAKGTKAPSDQWVAEHRELQPRDPETGQFETNAVNARETKYPGRGNIEQRKTKRKKWLENIYNRTKNKEFVVLDEQGKVALAKLDMTKEEFMETMQNYSKDGGFALRYKYSGKRGARSNYEKDLMAKGGMNESIISTKTKDKNGGNKYVPVDTIYNRSGSKNLTPEEEKAIAPVSAGGFKQALNSKKNTYHAQEEARKKADRGRNKDWKGGNVPKDAVSNLKDSFNVALQGRKPTQQEQAMMAKMSDPANIQKAMQKKNAKGEPIFSNFEEYRHWAMGQLV